MGLLLSHNCTLHVYPDLIKIKTPGYTPEVGERKRGKVQVFSRESRKRLFELLHSIEYKTCTFATLTYPAEFPLDGKLVKEHLRRFRARFERTYGRARVIWRLEFQKRGAPHFHLLVLDVPWLDRIWLSINWYECVGSNDYKHLKAGTNVKLVTNSGEKRLVMAYVGKYTGKEDQSEAPEEYSDVGRYWGKWNVTEKQGCEIVIDPTEANLLVTLLARERVDGNAYTPADARSCTLFGSNPGCSVFAERVVTLVHEMRLQYRNRRARILLPDGRD